MSLQSRLSSLITAIGADIKAVKSLPNITFWARAVNQGANATQAMTFEVPTSSSAVSIGTLNEVEMESDGKVVAVGLIAAEAVTGGTVTLHIRKNGANTGSTGLVLSTTQNRSAAKKIAAPITFVAGDSIGLAMVSSGLAPTTIDFSAFFTVVFNV